MKIRTKLVLLLALPLLALAWMGVSGYRQSVATAHQMNQIDELADLSVHISALVHETQKERGLTAGYYGSGGESFQQQLNTQRTLVDERLAELDGFLDGFDTSGYDPAFAQSLDDAVQRLAGLPATRRSATEMSMPAEQAIGYYTQTNAALLDTIGLIGRQSKDPQTTVRLVAYQNFLKGKERAGIERAVLSNTFAQDTFGPGMYRKFTGLVADQDTYLNEFRLLSDAETVRAYEKLSGSAEFTAVQAYRSVANDNAVAGGFGVDAEAWFDTITQKINALKDFEDQLSTDLIAAAQAKAAQARRASWVYGGTTLGVVVIVLTLALLVIRSILGPLRAIINQLKDIAEGEADLTRQADEARTDEFGELAGWFNTFVRRIHDVIADVASSSREVAAAATEIASSSEQMSMSAQEQTSQITQVSSAIEEMATSVIEVARKAADASVSAEQSGRTADEGGAIVRDTIEGMQGIDHAVSESAASVQELGKRGEQIGEVITVINDIADQTNLLALNAAIEAARAGEHGRGFAVVADEVRKLADRTTKATEEIAGSITAIQSETDLAVRRMTSGQEQVRHGVAKATEAGESLRQIVGSAKDVAAMIQAIAAASEEQSAASEQVSRSIQQISNITSENSAGISQSAAAATQLSQRSESLMKLIGQFKVHQND